MANKSIKELPKATQIQEDDALPMQQGSTTKQVTGLTLTLWLLDMADGHGGVTDFQKLSESGLEKTYQFTMADTTKYTFTVTDGNGVADFQHSVRGLVHTYKLIMDNGQEYTMTIKDGEKGDKGDNAYVWFRFASEKPTSSSSSMGTEPDAWIGFYSGNKAVAPTDPMEYTWAPFKGDKGNTGAPATIVTNKTEYQVSDSGTIIPSGIWSTSIPVVTPGKYLWTRTTTQFNTGSANYSYSISRFGIDGTGAVSTVNNVSPDEDGNVELTAEQLNVLGLNGGTMAGPINMNGQRITGLNPPIGDNEPETKGHAEETYIPKSGGTMTGPIHMSGQVIDGLNDPIEETEATRKGYVDKAMRAAAPRNLLDNSNFLNPVNQLGEKSYSGTSGVHTIDRWDFLSGGTTLTISESGITIRNTESGSYSIFNQKLERLPVGRYTLAAKSTNGLFCTTYDVDGASKDYPGVEIGNDWYMNINSEGSYPAFRFFSNGNKEITLEWAALYHGTYTAATLPEYQPKPYSQELAECLRHYRHKEWLNCVKSGGDFFSISKNIDMRIAPTYSFVEFCPFGSANVYDFNGCSLTLGKKSEVTQIFCAQLPTCNAHNAGGLHVTLDARL